MKKVIVIGAGAAGLAAAQKLKTHGVAVTVLEARTTIGGRVYTDRTFTDFPLELGGEFVHGDSTVIFDLISSDQSIKAGDKTGVALKVNGAWVADAKRAPYDAIYNEPAPNFSGGDISLAAYVASLDATPEVKKITALRMAGAYLAKPEDISAQELAYEDSVDHSGKGNFRLKDGYQPLMELLAEDLDIQLHTPVERVEWGSEGVQVFAKGRTYIADAVIVAVPLSMLQKQRIEFDPMLPEGKVSAINALCMGFVTKVILKFSKRFWSQSPWLFIQDEPHMGVWDPTYGRDSKDNVLTIFAIGAHAQMLDTLHESDIFEHSLTELSAMFDLDIRELFLEGKVVAWDKETWIEGGYSYVPLGAFGSRQKLAEPLGKKLFFAGEATAHSTNPATVHGAIESGWRVADEILAE